MIIWSKGCLRQRLVVKECRHFAFIAVGGWVGEGGRPLVGEWYAGIMVQSQTGLVEAAIFHREYPGAKTTKEGLLVGRMQWFSNIKN